MIRKGKLILLVLLLFTVYSKNALCVEYQKSKNIDKRIYKIIELSGAVQKGLASAQQVILNYENQIRHNNKDIPEEILNGLFDKFEKLMMIVFLKEDGPINLNAIIFSKYLTEKEIKSFLEFYESELWTKYRFKKTQLSEEEKGRLFSEYRRIFENETILKKRAIFEQELNDELVKTISKAMPQVEKEIELYLSQWGYRMSGLRDENPYRIKKLTE